MGMSLIQKRQHLHGFNPKKMRATRRASPVLLSNVAIARTPSRKAILQRTRNHFPEAAKPSRNKGPDIKAHDQTTECDHVETFQLALSRVLPGTVG